MKIIYGLVLLCVTALAIDKDTIKIIQTYRMANIEQTKELLESYLQKRDFWLGVLGDYDTNYGYFEGYNFLFISNKQIPNLSHYEINPNGKFRLIREIPALVAAGKGNKRLEGDKTTPIGVYDFTKKLSGLPPYYGPLAFATDYPNNYDKSQKRTGSGIWIHGLPLDGNREELNTKGCIAIKNDVLAEFGRIVDYKQALIIIYEKDFRVPKKEEIADILATLYAWRMAWINNDLESYLGFYSKDFIRPDGMKFNAFSEYKKQVFAKREEKSIIFSDISVVPYPNEEGRIMFRVSFNQDYKAYKNGKNTYSSNNYKILYISYENNQMKIISE